MTNSRTAEQPGYEVKNIPIGPRACGWRFCSSFDCSTVRHSIVRLFLALSFAFLLRMPSQAAEVQLNVDVAPRQVYLGESATLTVKVSGLSDAPEPDLSGVADCTVALQGSQDQNYQNVTIINGKMDRTGFRGRLFTYRVTPTATGTLPMGPVRLAHGGRMYQADGPALVVVGAEAQDYVIVKVESSRDTVIVEEPFDVTLAVAIRRLPGQYAGVDPFDTGAPPNLTVPYLERNDIPGLEGEEVQKLLQGLLILGRRGAGFGINGLTLPPDPLNSFFSFDSPAGATPAIFKFARSEETIDGKAYLVYRLRTDYVPKQEGAYTFGPITFKGAVFTAVDAAGQATPRRIFATAPALTVRVVPPPAAGRPDSYVGAIGANVTAEATLDTQTCNVGDPLRLALAIRGKISIDNLRAPVLGRQKQLAEAFRVYDDTVETETLPDGKRFSYTVRPIRAGTLEFPPVDVSYYDSNTRSYETVQTAPIPIVAYQADEVHEDFIVAATNDTAAVASRRTEGLLLPAPITVVPRGAEPAPPWLQTWQRLALLLGPALFLLVGAGAFVRLRLTTTAESRRRKAAMAEALRLVDRAGHKAGRSAAEGRALLMAGLRKYLANRLGGSEGGITPRDAARLLREHGVDQDLSQALVEVLDRSFNADYDPSAAAQQDVRADAHRVQRALKRLEKLVLAIVVMAGLSRPALADTVRNRFLWEEANTHLATAVEPRDYLAAAETYRELYALGVHNGPLLYNMGTAFLMAGQYDAARRALGGAEIYLGSSAAIERNMILALMAGDANAAAVLPWYRLPMFWHFKTPLRTRISVAVVAVSMGWLVGLLRLLGWRRGWRRLLALAVALIVMAGSSVLLSLHDLHRLQSDLALLRFQAETGEVAP